MENNPINIDMEYAARKANVQFTLSVVLDEEKKVIGAFTGDVIASHHIGCEFVKSLAKVDAISGDIVITSNGGYPLDQNLYQCPKGIASAEVCAGENGIIIIAAECGNGMGGDFFEDLMYSGTPQEILDKLSALPSEETIPEQWCAQKFSQTLLKHKIILVTNGIEHELIRKANLIPAASLEEAISFALKEKGKDASVVVIPDGVAVIPI
jgi:nickel-dependent lactate racemase